MPEKPRVYVTLLIETDRAPEDLHLQVLAALSDRHKVLHSGATAVSDSDDPDVTFVICPVRGLLRAFVDDPDAAAVLAKAEGAVTVEWSADADYRNEVTV